MKPTRSSVYDELELDSLIMGCQDPQKKKQNLKSGIEPRVLKHCLRSAAAGGSFPLWQQLVISENADVHQGKARSTYFYC